MDELTLCQQQTSQMRALEVVQRRPIHLNDPRSTVSEPGSEGVHYQGYPEVSSIKSDCDDNI